MKQTIKKYKKLFSVMLCLLLTMSIFSATNTSVLANDYAPFGAIDKIVIDHVVYAKVELANSKVSDYYMVHKFFDSVEYGTNATEINIVDEINGLPVTTINTNASLIAGFPDKLKVKKITLPKTITYIGEYAFTAFKNVKTLDLPKNLETIRPGAFYSMSSLKKITLPKKITVIEEDVFSQCKSLKTVKFKGKITKISDNAFSGCKKLKSVVIPNSTKIIGESAFAYSGITKIEMPSKIHLSSYTFEDCKKLKTVILNGSKKPTFAYEIFDSAKKGIKFYVKNKTVAKSLKAELKSSGAKKPKIYIGKKLYK